MEAIGVDTMSDYAKVDFESFLYLNQLINCDVSDSQEVIEFAVRLFDPKLQGFVKDIEFEQTMRDLFASETELANKRLDSNYIDESSLTDVILRDMRNEGVYQVGGYLNPSKL
jgi:hypothetical protein